MKSVVTCLLWICLLAVLVSAPSAACAAQTPFQIHWQRELVRLQGWPANAERLGDTLTFATEHSQRTQMRCSAGPADCSLPPVLYLVDREQPDSLDPGRTHRWAVLDVRALVGTAAAAQQFPNAEQVAFHEAVLTTVRALQVLQGQEGMRHVRAGLVGEGVGGALALAVAALEPDEVGFVCAHEPVAPLSGEATRGEVNTCLVTRWPAQAAQAAGYVDLASFASLVKAPTLLTVGEADQTAPPETIQPVYEALHCQSEVIPMRRARHCLPQDLREWQDVWHQWTRTTLGYS